MKYPVSSYAKALAGVVLEGKDSAAAAKNFLALVRRNGDEKNLRKIVEESERLIRKHRGTREITIKSARALKQSPRTLLKNFTKPDDEVHEVLEPELIAGVKIMIDGELQFDGSFKGKIDKLFN